MFIPFTTEIPYLTGSDDILYSLTSVDIYTENPLSFDRKLSTTLMW